MIDFPPPYSHFYDIIRKLTSLHQANHVNGDICNTNIMVKKDWNQGFKLVDFDWLERIGKVQYPMNVYQGQHFWRPHEVEDGQLIEADHNFEGHVLE